ncbi:ATP-binding protein [Candidatus Pacearchaeota archaeon]|nr:ATP-binding protein [Candidatus Pacearchaeota archaeon]
MLRRIVVTGGPCSGKSTLIKALKDKGYSVLEEVAREVLTERRNASLTREELSYRQLEILRRQESREKQLHAQTHKENLCFHDRGAFDNLAYARLLLGSVPEEIGKAANLHVYDTVFLLDLLSFLSDSVRKETPEEAQLIHHEIERTYKQRGHNLIKVPVLPVSERVAFILTHLHQLKGGD